MKRLMLLLFVIFCLTGCLTLYDMNDDVVEVKVNLKITNVYYDSNMDVYFWKAYFIEKKSGERFDVDVMFPNPKKKMRQAIESGKYKLIATVRYNRVTRKMEVYIAWILTPFKTLRVEIKDINDIKKDNKKTKKGGSAI